MWKNIPAEMMKFRSWVGGDHQGRPVNTRSLRLANVMDPATWGTYEQAVVSGCPFIGFVFSDADPYTGIDLDDKASNPATREQKERHYRIIKDFNSYTERSRSGRGFHIIVRGKVPGSYKRDKVEVYSRGHYFIMTGDVVTP